MLYFKILEPTLRLDGFTIIEVMIVLAVSGFILASAAALFSDKQSKTICLAANQFQPRF